MQAADEAGRRYVDSAVKYSSLGFAASVLALLLYFFHEETAAYAVDLGEWAKAAGITGMVVFGLLDALFVFTMLPGMIFTLMSGAIWGVGVGFIVAGLGKWIGAMLAFGAGRFLCAGMAGMLTHFESVKDVMKAVERTDWHVPLYLRLSPLIPYNLLNYALAMTNITMWTYAWTSFVGMIPGTLGLVYMGSMAGNIAKSIDQGDEFTAGNLLVLVISVVVSAFFMWLVRRVVSREMDKSLANAELPPPA